MWSGVELSDGRGGVSSVTCLGSRGDGRSTGTDWKDAVAD